ncbi:hypothetical protein ACIN8IBEIGE_50046 [Acinetobacter sp. 8I-beige]|nr:hypothetical protein ACIN8IBEIGE_50046 [Acinetobacter sp. 8I-beige]
MPELSLNFLAYAGCKVNILLRLNIFYLNSVFFEGREMKNICQKIFLFI